MALPITPTVMVEQCRKPKPVRGRRVHRPGAPKLSRAECSLLGALARWARWRIEKSGKEKKSLAGK
jgi:hypothetical protein